MFRGTAPPRAKVGGGLHTHQRRGGLHACLINPPEDDCRENKDVDWRHPGPIQRGNSSLYLIFHVYINILYFVSSEALEKPNDKQDTQRQTWGNERHVFRTGAQTSSAVLIRDPPQPCQHLPLSPPTRDGLPPRPPPPARIHLGNPPHSDRQRAKWRVIYSLPQHRHLVSNALIGPYQSSLAWGWGAPRWRRQPLLIVILCNCRCSPATWAQRYRFCLETFKGGAHPS